MTNTTTARAAYLASLERRALPETSYSNWCHNVGMWAGKHGARISFGTETYDAFDRGETSESYAAARGTR